MTSGLPTERIGVLKPEQVAEAIVGSVENRREEIAVPRWYGLYPALPLLLPTRVLAVLKRWIGAHGRLYHQEFGFDASFEALVAEIAASWRRGHDPACEAGWIAELDGVPVGSVFLVRQSDAVAKLRLLIVDPAARRLGIGARLVAECTRFARGAGYRLVASEGLEEFGRALESETWEMEL